MNYYQRIGLLLAITGITFLPNATGWSNVFLMGIWIIGVSLFLYQKEEIK